jgi:hypothetical protein
MSFTMSEYDGKMGKKENACMHKNDKQAYKREQMKQNKENQNGKE